MSMSLSASDSSLSWSDPRVPCRCPGWLCFDDDDEDICCDTEKSIAPSTIKFKNKISNFFGLRTNYPIKEFDIFRLLYVILKLIKFSIGIDNLNLKSHCGQ